MTGARTGSPRIHIAATAAGVAITQHRPAVLSALARLAVEQALDLVPRLLPICGMAQAIAAARAVEAAREKRPDQGQERARECRLLREQALSAGWRLAVDWPDLLGMPRPVDWLRELRNSTESDDIAALLAGALPGLASVKTLPELTDWARREESTAATTVHHALDIAAVTTSRPGVGELLSHTGLADTARNSLNTDHFDPLAPIDRPVEVGPLAMARDPLIGELQSDLGASTAARIMALVLDTRAITEGLRSGATPSPTSCNAWPEGRGAGTGRAVTARGPVFHRVDLDDRGNVARWRALAPTDWHFAPRGPVAGALDHSMSLAEAKLVVSSFDPCAPWELAQDGEA